MTKHNVLSVLLLVLVIAYFLSYTGLYGTGREVGVINMLIVFAVAILVVFWRRSAPKPPPR